jgi:hypothetical protein
MGEEDQRGLKCLAFIVATAGTSRNWSYAHCRSEAKEDHLFQGIIERRVLIA